MLKKINIENNLSTLQEMVNDLEQHKDAFYPGPYWQGYCRMLVDWLGRNDINDFRKYDYYEKAGIVFGGGSAWPSIDEIRESQESLESTLFYRIFRKLRFEPYSKINKYISLSNYFVLAMIARYFSPLKYIDKDNDIDRIEAAMVGNPSDVIEYKGKHYTPYFMEKFYTYITFKKIVDFKSVKKYMEVGPGAGLLAEILYKMHSGIKMYLVEIPPILYFLQQSLSAIFPGKVATYNMIKANPEILKDDKYDIFTLASWQMGLIPEGIDLFVNQAFEEMRKESVSAYLDHIKRLKTRLVFLTTIECKKGCSLANVFTPDDYISKLSEYDILYREKYHLELDATPYSEKYGSEKMCGNPAIDIIFKRK